MKLTKKSKEAFENWLVNDSVLCTMPFANHWFYEQPSSMQFGVYVDFFDSVGIDIRILENNVSSILNTNGFSQDRKYDYSNETRQEAREQAILKANEIYNKL